MRVHDVTLVVRRIVTEHHAVRGPDALGRIWTCDCGWWEPGVPFATHLLDMFDDAGLQLLPKETT